MAKEQGTWYAGLPALSFYLYLKEKESKNIYTLPLRA
jgi:hypothetical protein